MITFEKLFSVMEKRGISGYALLKAKVIGGGTFDRIKQGKSISTDTINDLCNYLHCKPSDIISYVQDKGE